MKKLHKSVLIKAPKENVWDVMLGEKTYPVWTTAFNQNSRFEGNWEEGAQMRFLGSGDDGQTMGMVSTVVKNEPHSCISLQHRGVIENGVENLDEEKVQEWQGAIETYTFTQKDGETLLEVEMDVEEKYEETMNEIWDKGLQKLKEIIEE
jgi:uncharacterized protein YndB with AHSA1/START domain